MKPHSVYPSHDIILPYSGDSACGRGHLINECTGNLFIRSLANRAKQHRSLYIDLREYKYSTADPKIIPKPVNGLCRLQTSAISRTEVASAKERRTLVKRKERKTARFVLVPWKPARRKMLVWYKKISGISSAANTYDKR